MEPARVVEELVAALVIYERRNSQHAEERCSGRERELALGKDVAKIDCGVAQLDLAASDDAVIVRIGKGIRPLPVASQWNADNVFLLGVHDDWWNRCRRARQEAQ